MAGNNNKQNATEAALPLMAAAVLNNATGGDTDALRSILAELATDQLEARRKDKNRKDRMALAAIQTVKEQIEQKKLREANCSHERQDKTSRLAGQRLSGTGQLCLVCQFCTKEFHQPPLEGQEAPPRHLIPGADSIGA